MVGQKTCDTRPRLHASCTVSFLPQNSISLACRWGDSDEVSPFQFNVKETELVSLIPTRATPRIWGNVYEEQPDGVRWSAAHGVWNHAFSLAHTTSHRGRMEAPKPRAGPFIATTMGFLKWMNADTKSLKKHNDDGKKAAKKGRGAPGEGAEVRFLIT